VIGSGKGKREEKRDVRRLRTKCPDWDRESSRIWQPRGTGRGTTYLLGVHQNTLAQSAPCRPVRRVRQRVRRSIPHPALHRLRRREERIDGQRMVLLEASEERRGDERGSACVPAPIQDRVGAPPSPSRTSPGLYPSPSRARVASRSPAVPSLVPNDQNSQISTRAVLAKNFFRRRRRNRSGGGGSDHIVRAPTRASNR
jgi:hypothetical protein